MTQHVITHLPFCGRPISAEELTLIRGIVEDYSGLGRTEIANTVCELLQWVRPTGKLKTVECRAFLESLEARGLLRLPQRRSQQRRGELATSPIMPCGESGAPLEGDLRDFQPLELESVSSPADQALWREWMQRYHYLGYRIPFGAHLRYFVRIMAPQPVRVGALQFSSAAWRMAARERWVGWSDVARRGNLQGIVSNSRFLILPWVRVPNLASSALALAARRLADDWEARYRIRPVLLETLVDPARFAGTCYRAANWIEVGQTTGRGRQDRRHQRHGASPKTIFLYPLAADARQRLCAQCAP
ncbi:MAG TPA: Druantia anti-phage system protein DruA [Anaerolineales bacterium]|nr:Druantia anti-phage system protein DruA [Anaerolineales bacterium]HLE16249.1 Druantia anti-phage system protein DruA [Anaerolineales bacterium]